MKQITKYDYSAVHAYFDRLNEVHRHRANKFRMNNIRSILPNTTLLMVGLGLACLLAFIGYSLIVNPKPIKVIEIPTIVEDARSPIKKSDSEIIKNIIEKEKSNQSPDVSPSIRGIIVENFVKFTHVSVHSLVDVSTVTTAKQYKIEGDLFPESQWCYIQKHLTARGASEMYTLSRVDEKGTKTNNINRSLSEQASISVSKLMQLEKKCVLDARFQKDVI